MLTTPGLASLDNAYRFKKYTLANTLTNMLWSHKPHNNKKAKSKRIETESLTNLKAAYDKINKQLSK